MDIQYQTVFLLQLQFMSVQVFLPNLQFMCQQRLFERKETLRLNSLISRLVLKQESWNNWPNRPAARTNCK